MSNALETTGLGKRYGHTWALHDCTLALPAGKVVALVGPNGAGKITLLHLCVGLLEPTVGSVQVFGSSPRKQPTETLPRLSFVAQDHPLYRGFTVDEMLKLGQKLNPHWDDHLAQTRMQKLDIPLNRRTGKLSGGQQAQVALVLALAKHPDLLVLDEPLASLDPLTRRDFLRMLMDAVVETGMTVLLSSHIIAELERVCDYFVILSASHVQLADDMQMILQKHKRLIGPRQDEEALASIHTIVEASHTERQTTLLVRTNGHIFDSSWQIQEASLEDVVLAYLSQSVTERLQSPSSSRGERNRMEVVK